jgi:hypothetical protein
LVDLDSENLAFFTALDDVAIFGDVCLGEFIGETDSDDLELFVIIPLYI